MHTTNALPVELFVLSGLSNGVMPYAIFSKEQQISKSFATAAEVWDHAESAGLVDYYEENGHHCRVLAEQYKVKKIELPRQQE